MQGTIIRIWTLFRWIFGVTAFMTLGGIFILWIAASFGKIIHLEFLNHLFYVLICEIIGLIFALAKKGFKYLPKIEVKKKQQDTIEFLMDFINNASTVTIVSNRLSWVDDDFIYRIKLKKESGTEFKIIIPEQQQIYQEKIVKLQEILGKNLFITKGKESPEARFTLINFGRSGAEKLAIAKGVYPEHEITIFDNHSGPQIIGMAKDIIRKSTNDHAS